MKILIISDTHGHIDDRIKYFSSKVDEIWHAGDIGKPEVAESLKEINILKAVYGNIDGQKIRSYFDEYLFFVRDSISVLLIHIAGKFPNYNKKTNALIKKFKPNILVCGHSHILKIINDKKNNLLYINPGAAGLHGFHKKRTIIKLEIKNQKIDNLEVIELKKLDKKLS